MPNPITQIRLSQRIDHDWWPISILTKSALSLSYPIKGAVTGRALVPFTAFDELKFRRAHQRSNRRYFLVTDILRFYDSVYTHSIPWAAHGKRFAKANQTNNSLVGNLLDSLTREGNDRQTIGIPIGPDTSLVIAELLLSAVDRALLNWAPKLKGFRFVDDYEFGFESRAEGEETLAFLQATLADFELVLNPTKTLLDSVPNNHETIWASVLRRFEISAHRRTQANDILAYFELVFDTAKRASGNEVYRYALARLRGETIHVENWPLLESLLMQVLIVEPGAIHYAFEVLIRHHHLGFALDLTRWEELINSVVLIHSRLGHGSEVAWSIWVALVFSLSFRGEAISAIPKMDESVVALLALHAKANGLMPSLDTTSWEELMCGEELYGRNWLLSYEANVKGWLPSKGGGDHVTQDARFSLLKAAGVEFYDMQQATAPVPTRRAPSTGVAPFFVLPSIYESTFRPSPRKRSAKDKSDESGPIAI